MTWVSTQNHPIDLEDGRVVEAYGQVPKDADTKADSFKAAVEAGHFVEASTKPAGKEPQAEGGE